ncbi:MAG: hypothetical protein IKE60_20345 [Reyranella sp.]|uniref:hypothetical protein n=1 Tax=Reyranella sp. TaxID=1929291 RepID=UPI0025EC0071|nr:hypothetical protein [Reyranella sp.]MBR2817018.1 hypothetical protein [Reyranella sp.]
MPSPSTPPPNARMSRSVKLVVMGVAGAALLYSCAPGVGAGLGALPYLWFFSNPFYRGAPTATACPPGTPPGTACGPTGSSSSSGSGFRSGSSSSSSTTTTSPSGDSSHATPGTSQRGGFGSSASSSGSSSSS